MLRSRIEPSLKVLGAVFATLLGAFAVAAQPAAAEPRVALVIGNSAYKGDLPALPNPANDARLMVQALKNVGFDVVEAEDASQTDMKKAIVEFGDKLTAAGSTATGLFFYAGHGVQVGGENYLIPVDAQIQKEADVDLSAVSATSVMKQMDFAGSAVNIIILDACRNNPLAASSRGMTRGLAEIQSKPRGSFIAYSTAPGSTAADGDSTNSPYTKALAETIQEPGLSIGDVFQEVRTKVLAETGNQQTPWDSSSLTGRFYFKAPPQTQTAAAPNDAPSQPSTGSVVGDEALATEKLFWDSVKDSGDPESIQLYLKKYPSGYFVDAANAKLAELKDTQVASVTPAEQPAAKPADGAIDHGTAQPAQPAKPAAVEPQVAIIALNQTVYAKGDGRVRAAPSGKADLLTQFPRNAEVSATGRTSDGRWWRVALSNGEVGYMHESVVSEQPFQAAAVPAQPAPAQPSSITPISGGGIDMQATGNIQPVQTGTPISLQDASQIANAVPSGSAQLNQAISGLASLLGGGVPQQQVSVPQGPTATFVAYNRTVVLRSGAIVLNQPGNGQPIGRANGETQLQASARSTDGTWYQVVLQDGTFGFVARQWLAR